MRAILADPTLNPGLRGEACWKPVRESSEDMRRPHILARWASKGSEKPHTPPRRSFGLRVSGLVQRRSKDSAKGLTSRMAEEMLHVLEQRRRVFRLFVFPANMHLFITNFFKTHYRSTSVRSRSIYLYQTPPP